jgi:hypothetical protein
VVHARVSSSNLGVGIFAVVVCGVRDGKECLSKLPILCTDGMPTRKANAPDLGSII